MLHGRACERPAVAATAEIVTGDYRPSHPPSTASTWPLT
jgi:hypothetical protein